jgi:hypothetical protein
MRTKPLRGCWLLIERARKVASSGIRVAVAVLASGCSGPAATVDAAQVERPPVAASPASRSAPAPQSRLERAALLDGPHRALERFCAPSRAVCEPVSLSGSGPWRALRVIRGSGPDDPIVECTLAIEIDRGWYLQPLGECGARAGTFTMFGEVGKVAQVPWSTRGMLLLLEWTSGSGPRHPGHTLTTGEVAREITTVTLFACAHGPGGGVSCAEIPVGRTERTLRAGAPVGAPPSTEVEIGTAVDVDWRLDHRVLPEGLLELRLRDRPLGFTETHRIGVHPLVIE